MPFSCKKTRVCLPGVVPSQEEVAGIFTTITSEINISSVEHVLFAAVLKNISKTIKLFCVKCEQAAKADSDASQVIGQCLTDH